MALRKLGIVSKDKREKKILDTGANLARTVIELSAEVAQAFNGVPYVGAIAGIVVKIIKIRDVSLALMQW